jgi:hypothetical protein
MADTKKVKLTKEMEALREILLAKRDELAKRIEERRQEILVDHEPEDEVGIALRSSAAGLAIANIEREVRTLSEIDLCLRLMDPPLRGMRRGRRPQLPNPPRPRLQLRLIAAPGITIKLPKNGGLGRRFLSPSTTTKNRSSRLP